MDNGTDFYVFDWGFWGANLQRYGGVVWRDHKKTRRASSREEAARNFAAECARKDGECVEVLVACRPDGEDAIKYTVACQVTLTMKKDFAVPGVRDGDDVEGT